MSQTRTMLLYDGTRTTAKAGVVQAGRADVPGAQPVQTARQQAAQAEVADEVPGAAGPAGVLQEFGDAVGVQLLGAAFLHRAHQGLGALDVVRGREVREQVEPVAAVFGRELFGALADGEFVDEYVGHRAVGDGAAQVVLARGHPGVQDRPVGALLGAREHGGGGRLPEPGHEQRAGRRPRVLSAWSRSRAGLPTRDMRPRTDW
ncbi:hypothetical protein ABZ953_03860 [Streptomyces sp. NPDC046465]|uniref:hypothetical protein n=1 Tax=Streptomyces sp. NPDC046465 TaxID=3155810 RepID=UPI0033FF0095